MWVKIWPRKICRHNLSKSQLKLCQTKTLFYSYTVNSLLTFVSLKRRNKLSYCKTILFLNIYCDVVECLKDNILSEVGHFLPHIPTSSSWRKLVFLLLFNSLCLFILLSTSLIVSYLLYFVFLFKWFLCSYMIFLFLFSYRCFYFCFLIRCFYHSFSFFILCLNVWVFFVKVFSFSFLICSVYISLSLFLLDV